MSRIASILVVGLVLIALAGTLLGATSTRSFTNDSRGAHPGTITGDNSQITVDLSALPAGTQIYRAVFVHNRAGHSGTSSWANQPLRIEAADDPGNWLATLSPRHMYFDCTAAAQRGVQASPRRLVLNMVSFPGFSFSAGVRVDITCDQPVVHAIQALTNINARHSAGDTMVTWTEREQLLPDPNSTVGQYEAAELTFNNPNVIRYRIYRHTQPIDATTIRTAELVDEITPLSAWNPYYYGLYWRDTDTNIVPRLPVDNEVLAAVDQGIYVRRAPGAGSAYYAISLAIDGEEDLSNWTAGQNTTGSAVSEAVGTGMVVLRVKMLDVDFMYESHTNLYYYVRWDCPPYYNIPSHPLDYLVGVPNVAISPRPVDVALHCWGANLNGGFGWWYEADKGALLLSTNMQPYDWWTAYHDNYGTVRPFTNVDGNAGGRVRNYAQDRILSFLNDFVKQNYSVDDNRILVTGISMGGAGCIMWGARAAETFNYANGWVGVYIPRETPQFKSSFEGCYGLDAWNCEYENTGVAAFDYWDSAQFISANPGQAVPYLCFANGKNDSAIGWPQAYTFVNSLIQARQPFKFKWGQGGHGERSVLPAGNDRYIGIIIRKNVTLPAFTNCSLDDNMGNGDPADGDPAGNINAYTLWETDTTTDLTDQWAATVYLASSAPVSSCTVDITPRRCQAFSTPQGTQVSWTNTDVATGQPIASGTAVADQWGLVTLTGLTISKTKNRISMVKTGAVTVSFDLAASNGDESVTPANLAVSLSQTSGDTVTVDYAVTGGTATGGGVDYTLNPGTLQFDPGQTTKYIPITIVDDPDPESDETIQVTLSNPVNASLGAITVHTYTINDNDPGLPVVTLQATDPAAAEEGQDTGTFTVTRNDTSGNLVVHYTVSGTAEAADYEETLSGSVTIPDTQNSAAITITPVDDTEVEGSETVILTLSADPAYQIGSPSIGTVTIADNDTAGPSQTFYVTRDNGVNCADAYDNQGATSDVRSAKWGADESYLFDFDTAAILAFMGSNPISDYSFTLYVMPSSGWPASPATVNVQTVNTNYNWAEGDDAARFNSFGWTEGTPAATGEYAQCYWKDVGGTPTLDVDNCVAWTREDGTPESEFKYLPVNFTNSSSLVGSSADHGTYISVVLDEALVNDLLNNAKNRGLRLYRADGADNLQNYTREAAANQRPYLEVVYIAGPVGPEVAFTGPATDGSESAPTAHLRVELAESTTQTATVDYAATGGTAQGGGVDYTLAAGTLQFAPGETVGYIDVAIVDDGSEEGDETIVVTLSNPVNCQLGAQTTHTYTILDQDRIGQTWNCSTVAQMENAWRNCQPNDEIVLAAGTYVLEAVPTINTHHVIMRGATGNPDDVILTGPGMNVNQEPRTGIVVQADNFTIMDLTVREVYHNGIHVRGENDVDRVWIHNVKTFNCGERHLKCSRDPADAGRNSEDTLVELVVMEADTVPSGHPDNDYVGGLDYFATRNLIIRDCAAINIRGATGGARGGIFLWAENYNFTVERNKIYSGDCGIAIGNPSFSEPGHCAMGGILRNNFVTRGAYIALELCFTKDVNVFNNTIYSEDANYFRTVHIYGGTTTNLQSKYNIIRGQVFANGANWTDVGSIIGTAPQPGWFTNWAVGDLHLTPSATPAIDAASPLAEVPDDFDEDPRGESPDIGADEFIPTAVTVQFDLTASNGDESVTPANLAVSLSGVSSQVVTVDYAVTGGTAAGGGVDYTLNPGQLQFDPGQVTKYIPIAIVDDGMDEDDETVEVTLSNPVNATLGANTVHTYTINDNDAPPTVQFNLTASNGDEAVTPANLAVSLSAASGKTITVDYAPTGGTAAGGGVDYTLNPGSLQFDPGQTSKKVQIAIVNDTLDEDDETIQVTLSNPVNATLGANTVHTYTINDNDAAPTVQFNLTASNGDESVTPANLAVSLSAASGKTITVNYAPTGGTATGGGVDYTLAAGQLQFDPGQTSKNIAITIVDDPDPESDETIVVTLSNPVNATLGANTVHTYTINDNDQAGPEQLFSDGFESGNFTAGGWTTSGSASVSSQAAHTGTYGAKLARASTITKALSTAGYADIHVKCWWRAVGLDSGEYLYCEWSDNGGQNWYELGTTQSTSWSQPDFTCPAGAANNPNFRVRFRTNANKTSEYGCVDDVEIIGTAQ